ARETDVSTRSFTRSRAADSLKISQRRTFHTTPPSPFSPASPAAAGTSSPSADFAWATAPPRGGAPSSSPVSADRKSTRLNSSHVKISYAVFCLKKKKEELCEKKLKPKDKTNITKEL